MYNIEKSKCADCGYCFLVCPFNAIIHHVEEKYYEIDQEKCKQCGLCYQSCITKAINASNDQEKITKIYISNDCIGCSMCSRLCPNQAIEGVIKQKFNIDENKCIKCGVCASKCPKKAIIVEKALVNKEK